jgi:hypothetical protein
MSFALPPAVTQAGAPGINDDATKGYVVGSSIVDTSVSPRNIYFCTDASAGAAVWKVVGGGTSDHSALSNLAFTLSGHTGAATSVAAFNGAGVAQTVQATADNTMLVRQGGVLQWVPMVALISFSGLAGSMPADLSLGGFAITAGVFA